MVALPQLSRSVLSRRASGSEHERVTSRIPGDAGHVATQRLHPDVV